MATSPPGPFPASLPNPKKRPSISSSVSLQNASKRPKLHPLSQTSYPLNASTAYSAVVATPRSETGSITNSMMSGTSAKRPRGRPRKSMQLQPDDLQASQNQDIEGASQVDAETQVRGGTKSVVSAKSGAPDAEEEDEPEEVTAILNDQEKDQEKLAKARESQLVETFDADQTQRYTSWRRTRLNPPTLRRLINAVVSQSVGPAPLSAVNQFSKYFLGEIVERARDVQIEWAKAYEQTREKEKIWRAEELQRLEARQIAGEDDHNRLLARDIARLGKEVDEYVPNPHKGGLLPDHLREALRRYRADGDGGGVGLDGSSHGLLGSTGSAIWRQGDGATGRRLFR